MFMHTPVRLIVCAALLACVAVLAPARAQVATLPAMHAGQASVSGLSAGGYMAVQFDVAYSASLLGAGVIAGGPYYCARGDLDTATAVCSCTGFGSCRVRTGGARIAELIAATDRNGASGAVDPVTGLASHKIWLFSGSADTTVPPPVMQDLRDYYAHYVTPANIFYKGDIAAQHAMPTDSFGNACDKLGSPYINNCAFDAAGALLQWIYGTLAPRSTQPPAGRFVEFDQAEFLPNPRLHGMAANGVLYVPPGCDGAEVRGCKLHVVFHGCKQDRGAIGEQYIRQTGYNAWADSNRIVLLYPQATASGSFNPNACWDWYSHDDPAYATKTGRQMLAVKHMVDRLTGALPGTPPALPGDKLACVNASNAEHVRAGRAYARFLLAYAAGSNQFIGVDADIGSTTLKRTGPGHYVFSWDAC